MVPVAVKIEQCVWKNSCYQTTPPWRGGGHAMGPGILDARGAARVPDSPIPSRHSAICNGRALCRASRRELNIVRQDLSGS